MKSIHKSQSGVADLTIVGLLLIFAVVGFTGWRVWEARKDSNAKLDSGSSTTSANSEPSKQEPYKVPDGYVVFEGKEQGFKFSYPKRWEDVHPVGYEEGKNTFIIKKDTDISVTEGCEECLVKYDATDGKWYAYFPNNKERQVTTEEVKLVDKNEKTAAYLLPIKGAMNCGTYAVLFHYKTYFAQTHLSMCTKPTSSDDHQPDANTLWYDDVVAEMKKVVTTFAP
jgi:hypothetical protein